MNEHDLCSKKARLVITIWHLDTSATELSI